MLGKLQTKKEEGFTIIEVLIVLAIAGLIMLIVFLAVPALQRNSRNNGRKNDVARMGAAVNDFIGNNNGAFPTAAQLTTLLDGQGAFAQYDLITNDVPTPDPASDLLAMATGPQAITADVAGVRSVRLVTSAQCGTAGATLQGSDRQAAIQYKLETSSNTTHDDLCLNI